MQNHAVSLPVAMCMGAAFGSSCSAFDGELECNTAPKTACELTKNAIDFNWTLRDMLSNLGLQPKKKPEICSRQTSSRMSSMELPASPMFHLPSLYSSPPKRLQPID